MKFQRGDPRTLAISREGNRVSRQTFERRRYVKDKIYRGTSLTEGVTVSVLVRTGQLPHAERVSTNPDRKNNA